MTRLGSRPFDTFWPAMAKRRNEHLSARGCGSCTALRARNQRGSRFYFGQSARLSSRMRERAAKLPDARARG